MIGSIAPYVSKFRRSYQSNDIIDRLNYQYTALVIAFAAFTLAATQYVGKPIQCWVPAQFTGAWEKYTETYCFIKGSYFQRIGEEIPDEYVLRERKEIHYYQWVPIVLAIQAFLFYFPCLIWKALNFRSDSDDIISKLNYRYSSLILLTTGMTLAGMLYIKQPIQCWFPAEFTLQWENYAESFCFVHGSYFVKDATDQSADNLDEDCIFDRSKFIGFYQWLPLLLILQAFMFLIPSFVWQIFSGKSGINVKGVLNSAAQVKKKFDKSSRASQVQTAANHLEEAMEMQKELKTGTMDVLHFSKRRGIYLVALYLVSKIIMRSTKHIPHNLRLLTCSKKICLQLLYVINAMLQLVILNMFLGPEYKLWGYGILMDLLNNKMWRESGHFPRVTMCDFHVRVLGNIHRWTVQCVLMINMWWLIFVGVLSILSLLYYLFALVFKGNQRYFVERYLRCSGAVSATPNLRENGQLSDFTDKYLRPDGVFLLRLIETNGGDLLVGEITTALFERYKTKTENSFATLPATESPASTSPLQR
ncbi:unnamed protein product [Enterobius vermicularis]|uniref:Innexin n=1 Tax=Enterobius vermicularis TaxID=51028 RepID=A0A0N4V8X6_ENTVE|nr:unnamed protein product [Enterobius vermicularis]